MKLIAGMTFAISYIPLNLRLEDKSKGGYAMPKQSKSSNQHYSDEELEMLKGVNKRLALLVDYRYQLQSGVLRGIGFAIGASIIGAIIVAALLSIFEAIDNPFVDEVIDSAGSSNVNQDINE